MSRALQRMRERLEREHEEGRQLRERISELQVQMDAWQLAQDERDRCTWELLQREEERKTFFAAKQRLLAELQQAEELIMIEKLNSLAQESRLEESHRSTTSSLCLRCLVLEAEREELLTSLEVPERTRPASHYEARSPGQNGQLKMHVPERSPREIASSSVSLVSAREASIPDNVLHVSTAAPLSASLDTCDVGPLEVVQPRMRPIEALPYKSCLKAPESPDRSSLTVEDLPRHVDPQLKDVNGQLTRDLQSMELITTLLSRYRNELGPHSPLPCTVTSRSELSERSLS